MISLCQLSTIFPFNSSFCSSLTSLSLPSLNYIGLQPQNHVKTFAMKNTPAFQQQQRKTSLCREVASSRSSGEAKRPRGRPPGSKNKPTPKPPVVIEREAEPSAAMRPHVLEIPSGRDVADSIAAFCRRRNLGLCVLSGTGAVADVALRQPDGGTAAAGLATITFRGRFEILSVSATFLPQAMVDLSPAARGESISISLAGPRGQVVGGTVTGPLVAAETVALVVAAFANPTFHRLPAEDMQEHDQHANAQRRHEEPAAESIGLFTYGSHEPSNAIWPPISRQPF